MPYLTLTEKSKATTRDLYYYYYPDAMLPVHIVRHHEATAKSTTQDGGMAETSVNAFV